MYYQPNAAVVHAQFHRVNAALAEKLLMAGKMPDRSKRTNKSERPLGRLPKRISVWAPTTRPSTPGHVPIRPPPSRPVYTPLQLHQRLIQCWGADNCGQAADNNVKGGFRITSGNRL